MSEPLRAGIVGYGYMGEIRHRTIHANPELRLVAIADPRLMEPPEQGVALFRDYPDLLACGVDVVFVCTPTAVTPNIAEAALARGCHVFCEKPPGRSVADIRRIMRAEEANPMTRLIFGFNHRHHPGVIEAKAIVDHGALGRVLTLRGVYGKSGGDGFEQSWRNDPACRGGILLDQGIHMLDLFRFFCGDFEEVTGMVTTSFWRVPFEDNAFVLLRNAQGQMAQLHSSATAWKHTFRLEIGLEHGYLAIAGLLSKTGSYGRETLLIGRKPQRHEQVALGNPREEISYYDRDTSWELEVAHFIDCIRRQTPVTEGTSLDALRVMEIIERVYRDSGSLQAMQQEEWA